MTVEQSWQRITAALSSHAPATAREIRPPAPAGDVEALQRLVGLDFPADVLEWWSITDGIDDERDFGGNRDGRLVPDGYVPLGVRRAAEEYRRQAELPDQDCCDPGRAHRKSAGDTGFPYCTALLPLCRDSGGGLLCVDLRDGEDRGWIMRWSADEGYFPSDWASVTDVLAEIADRLEQEPVPTEGGALVWP
ncbi:SMI1/KNR4 family protein [Lentzea flava]|uniref:SMI1/KNR4 family protein n=1 Tax=Lentzea flava TaxID=103732 RepID=UPI001E579530|nr:SMI1/KNR4 family protein [Lentzea flava]